MVENQEDQENEQPECFGTQFGEFEDCDDPELCPHRLDCAGKMGIDIDEYDKKNEEEEKEEEEEEEEKKEEKSPEGNPFHAAITKLIAIYSNPLQVAERQLHPGTCKYTIDLLQELIKHGGKEIIGMRAADGSVMHPCPKHGFGPITLCMKEEETGKPCEYFEGNDNTGMCICKEERIMGFKQYTYCQAKQITDQMRFNEYSANLKKIEGDKKLQNEELPEEWKDEKTEDSSDIGQEEILQKDQQK